MCNFKYTKYFNGIFGITDKCKFRISNFYFLFKFTKELVSLYSFGKFSQKRDIPV